MGVGSTAGRRTPIYRQLDTALRKLVLEGTLAPGTKTAIDP